MSNFRQTLAAVAIHEEPFKTGENLSLFLSGWWAGIDFQLKESPIGQVITNLEGQADHPDYAKNPKFIRR